MIESLENRLTKSLNKGKIYAIFSPLTFLLDAHKYVRDSKDKTRELILGTYVCAALIENAKFSAYLIGGYSLYSLL